MVPALHHPPTSRMVLAHVLGFTLSTALLVQVERLGIFHLGSSKKCGHVGVNMGQPLWFDGFFSGFSRVMLDYRRVCRVSGAEGLHVWERRREVTFVSKLTGEEEYCAILCLLDFMLMDFG